MRPAVFQVGGTLYWVIQTRNPDTMVLKDADSTPSVAVRKNGASVADAVTITKRSATTGIYDCSYNPASEVEGDSFTLEESATVTGTTTSSATYNFNWSVRTVRTGAVELDSATALQLDDIETAVDANTGYLTSVLAKLGAITGGGANTVLGFFKALWSKDATLPSDLGGTAAPATDSLEAIRDRGDAAWITGGGGGESPSYEAVVVTRMPVGVTVGWPTELIIGDAYLTETLTAPKLFIRDIDDNVLAGLGSKAFSDEDFVGKLRLAPLTTATRDSSLPAATVEVSSDDTPGIVFNADTADAEYFELQIPHVKTLLGVVKTEYAAQFIMNWGADRTYERTVNLGKIKFIRKTSAAT